MNYGIMQTSNLVFPIVNQLLNARPRAASPHR
jgi:hypothetical protein